MRENVVEYGRYHFSSVWDRMLKIKIKGYDISNYTRYVMMNCKLEYITNDEELLDGVYYTKNTIDDIEYLGGRSLINYMDTNYQMFATLINWINKQIVNGRYKKHTQIDFNIGRERFELFKYFQIIQEYKEEIFDPKSDVFTELLQIAKETSERGLEVEILTANKLMSLKGISNVKLGKFGSKKDMFKGIDISFDANGKEHGVQCKSCSSIELIGDYYHLKGVVSKKYKIKYVIFYAFHCKKTEEFMMFTNNEKFVLVDPTGYRIHKNLKRNIS